MITKLNCGRSTPLAIDVHPNNQLVACGCENGSVMLWDCSRNPSDARAIWCKKAFDSRVTDVKFTQDGSLLLGSCIDGSLCAFNLKEKEKEKEPSVGSSSQIEIFNDQSDFGFLSEDGIGNAAGLESSASLASGGLRGRFGGTGEIVMRTEAYASTIDSITVTDYNLVCTTGRSLRGNVPI